MRRCQATWRFGLQKIRHRMEGTSTRLDEIHLGALSFIFSLNFVLLHHDNGG